jgi:hypothetical protein
MPRQVILAMGHDTFKILTATSFVQYGSLRLGYLFCHKKESV